MRTIHITEICYKQDTVALERYFDSYPNLAPDMIEYILGSMLWHKNNIDKSLYQRV